jgi:hypothetical protein
MIMDLVESKPIRMFFDEWIEIANKVRIAEPHYYQPEVIGGKIPKVSVLTELGGVVEIPFRSLRLAQVFCTKVKSCRRLYVSNIENLDNLDGSSFKCKVTFNFEV